MGIGKIFKKTITTFYEVSEYDLNGDLPFYFQNHMLLIDHKIHELCSLANFIRQKMHATSNV